MPTFNTVKTRCNFILISSNDIDSRNVKSDNADILAKNTMDVAKQCVECVVSEIIISCILPKRNINLSKLIREVNGNLTDLCDFLN